MKWSKKKKNTLRLGTWNVPPWMTKYKEIISDLKEKLIDICALSGIKKKDKGNVLIYHGAERYRNDIKHKHRNHLCIVYAPVISKPAEWREKCYD